MIEAGYNVVRTGSYHLQANGRLERKHREISKLCRMYNVSPHQLDLSLIPRKPQQAQVAVLAVQDDRVDSEDEEPPELLEDETKVM